MTFRECLLSRSLLGSGADFRRANVRGAKFGRANLRGAIGLPPDIQTQPELLDLGEALSDLGMLIKRLLGEKFALEMVHGRDLWPVFINIRDFEQVIVDLVVGIREELPAGGKFIFETSNLNASHIAHIMPPVEDVKKLDYVLVEIRVPKFHLTAMGIQKLVRGLRVSKTREGGTIAGGIFVLRSVGLVAKMASVLIFEADSDTEIRVKILIPRYQGAVEATGRA